MPALANQLEQTSAGAVIVLVIFEVILKLVDPGGQQGNLYITEDPGGSFASGKRAGDDVWFAPRNSASSLASLPIRRFLSITDCDAEPTGVYVSPSGRSLFVNVQHRGGADPRDLSIAVQRMSDVSFNRVAK